MFWLVKTDPVTYSWNDLLSDGSTIWDGVRNFQAKKYLSMMKSGDLVLVYHSQRDKAIIGIAEVIEEAFPDPTVDDPRWLAVKLKAYETLPRPVTLDTLKKIPLFSNFPLLRQMRLSVMPVEQEFYNEILRLAGKS
ncbi:MAG: EVE domain-containing protein [Candidatus Kapaibacteriales bacterium]